MQWACIALHRVQLPRGSTDAFPIAVAQRRSRATVAIGRTIVRDNAEESALREIAVHGGKNRQKLPTRHRENSRRSCGNANSGGTMQPEVTERERIGQANGRGSRQPHYVYGSPLLSFPFSRALPPLLLPLRLMIYDREKRKC